MYQLQIKVHILGKYPYVENKAILTLVVLEVNTHTMK